MIDNEIGGNLKLARFTDAEMRAFICGVLPIASKAEPRGAFMVGRLPATAEDVSHQSRKTTVKTAESLLAKMRALGMLEHDQELDAEWLHDWEEYNPDPKADPTHADRQARYRARKKAETNGSYRTGRDGGVTASRDGESDGCVTVGDAKVTPAEVKKRNKENPPKPPQGGNVVKFDRKPVPDHRLELAQQILVEFNQQAGTNLGAFKGDGKPSEGLTRIISALTAYPDHLTAETSSKLISRVLGGNRWWDGPPHPGVVFSHNVVEKHLDALNGQQDRQRPSDWDRLTGGRVA